MVLSVNATLIFKYKISLISNKAVTFEFILSVLTIIFQYSKFSIHFSEDVTWMSGSSNFKKDKLEDPRNRGIEEAHTGMEN